MIAIQFILNEQQGLIWTVVYLEESVNEWVVFLCLMPLGKLLDD